MNFPDEVEEKIGLYFKNQTFNRKRLLQNYYEEYEENKGHLHNELPHYLAIMQELHRAREE